MLAKLPWLKPLAVEVFAGKLDPAKLRFPDSLLTMLPASPLHGMPATDARDWAAIRTWRRLWPSGYSQQSVGRRQVPATGSAPPYQKMLEGVNPNER